MRHYRFYILFVAVLTLSGCADFLDRDPLVLQILFGKQKQM